MPFAKARDINVYYELAGSGPRLLFINGTGGDLRRKPSVFDSLLAQHFEVLAYDQRGLGQTDKPDAVYAMEDYAEDAAALLDAMGWERCLVMGVSFGGMVGQELAVRHLERIERLVLACTSPGGAGGHSYPLHELQALPPLERARRQMAISDARWTEEWAKENPERYQNILQQTVDALRFAEDEPGRREGFLRQLEARRNHDVYDRLPALKMPVFICGGRYDALAPPRNLEAIKRQVPHAQLEFFEGGHLFLLQDRNAYPRVVEFLLHCLPSTPP